MRASRRRTLLMLLLVACASLQASASSALVALTLAVHGEDHVHVVSTEFADGHSHLVLSHEEAGDLAHAHAGDHDTLSETDHVFHVTNDDVSASCFRRPGVAPAWAPMVSVALTAPTRAVAHARPHDHARAIDSKALVLRL